MQPRAYYNEHDPFCAAWLYNLIQQNLIAPGDIDTRDIRDIKPIDLRGYTQHHFFAGIGGWSLALRLAGVGDHEAVWTGSCPCQPFSAAGRRGGFADERHLWPSFYHLGTQCRPPVLFGEQVASASDWLRLVRGDLETLDYAVGAIPVEAASAGADHLRDRFWFVADHEYAREGRWGVQRSGESSPAAGERPSGEFAGPGFNNVVANGNGKGFPFGERDRRVQREAVGASERQAAERDGLANSEREQRFGQWLPESEEWNYADTFGSDGSSEFSWVLGADGKARRVKPGVRLLVDGFPNRVGLLRGFGNAIDPRPASKFIEAWREAKGILK